MSTIPSTTVMDGVAAAAAAAGTAGASQTSSAQDQFLQLLVTQLQNQDPLNPMDNAEMTSQLAQINMVNGIDQLNTTMQGLTSGFGATQALQAASLIGHQVLAPGDTMQLASGQATAGVSLAQPVDKLVVTVLDASGNLLHSVDLGPQPAGVVAFQWDGMTDSGSAAADGSYTFKVDAQQGGAAVPATTLSLGQVASVSQDSSGVTLNLSGQGAVALSDVKQIL